LLTVTVLAASCPLLIAPAMDGGMFAHPSTQENLQRLRERGVQVIGPEEGHLASGLQARGRMTEPQELVGQIRYLLSRGGLLQGRRVVVTAGGTQEPVDPVRVLSNRSSGKQGFALAQAALDAGAEVTLIAAPVALAAPAAVRRVDVGTAAEMAEAVLAACHDADALLMAAAVADFRPAQAAGQKLKKERELPSLALERTTDILAEVGRLRKRSGHPLVVVGFAAETEGLLANALGKLRAKGLDLIVANDVSAAGSGFGVDTNQVTLLDASGGVETLPLMSKTEVAEKVIDKVIGFLDQSTTFDS
jgi:phosphopantothenoylcysteine decarboxylase/phosphopantothenate--cysteine ligase